MPYPVFENRVFETANGLRVEFLDPGKRQVRLSYASRDGRTRFDVSADCDHAITSRAAT